MPKVKLNATFCAAATCQPGKRKTDYWDSQIPGFLLEVRSSGGRTYHLRWVDGSHQKMVKISGYNDITFAKARDKAKRLRSEVVLGGDPAGRKKEKKAIPTYAALAAQHVEYAKTYQRRPENTQAILENHLLPRFGRLRLDEIKPDGIAAFLADKAKEGLRPATIDKVRIIMGRSWEIGRKLGVPGTDHNPVRSVSRPRFNNARHRYLTAQEAARLRKAVERSSNPQLEHIVGLLLLTGARVSELLQAKWQDVDTERRLWHIPTSKTGAARHVPLSQAATDIIGQLPRFNGCPYLVPNPDTRKPYVSIKKAWQTARAEAGLPDLRIHDLRHSAASFMINAGIDLYAVGRVLGHSDHKSTMRYAHLANETLLAAVEAGAKQMKSGWRNPSDIEV